LRIYCKNFRPKFEVLTKLYHIIESTDALCEPRGSYNGLTSLLLLPSLLTCVLISNHRL